LIRQGFCDDVTHGYFTDIEVSLRREENTFAINLIAQKTFSLKQRKMIRQAMRVGFSLLGITVIVLSVIIFTAELKIRRLESSYKLSDYEYAVGLQQQIKEL